MQQLAISWRNCNKQYTFPIKHCKMAQVQNCIILYKQINDLTKVENNTKTG